MTGALTAVAVLTAVLAIATAVEIVRSHLWELAPLVLACAVVAATSGALAALS